MLADTLFNFAGHNHDDHVHDPGVSSVSIVCDGALDLDKVLKCLELFLSTLSLLALKRYLVHGSLA
jgi:hypothetical protein